MRKPYFPMFIDISEKKIVMVGGGKIAKRRINTLLLFAGYIVLVAPEIDRELEALAGEGKISWKKAFYSPDVLKEADMVFAATDDRVCNEQIAADCKKRGIPVNTAHKKELCDFYFPAVAVQESVVAGITTSGLSHRKARKIREEICRLLENTAENEEDEEGSDGGQGK